jgi:hypothetical protein
MLLVGIQSLACPAHDFAGFGAHSLKNLVIAQDSGIMVAFNTLNIQLTEAVDNLGGTGTITYNVTQTDQLQTLQSIVLKHFIQRRIIGMYIGDHTYSGHFISPFLLFIFCCLTTIINN